MPHPIAPEHPTLGEVIAFRNELQANCNLISECQDTADNGLVAALQTMIAALDEIIDSNRVESELQQATDIPRLEPDLLARTVIQMPPEFTPALLESIKVQVHEEGAPTTAKKEDKPEQ